jgi:cation diffusion facilitator CzcD-associated flavoprotein CzcO
MLKTLRDRGLKTVIFEAGNDTGGTWRWNCYPGAGVDSEVPEYEFSWPEVYETWNWPNNYPDYQNLRDYFDHVDKVIGIKKDCAFNTVIIGAQFDTKQGKWSVQTADGRTTKAKYLVLGTGFVSRLYISLGRDFTDSKRRLPSDTFLPGPAWTNSRALFTTHHSGPRKKSR